GLYGVGALSAGEAHKAPSGLAFNGLAEDVIGEHILLRVAQGDALAAALQAAGLLLERVYDAVLRLVLRQFGTDLVFTEIDERGGRFHRAVADVDRIIVVGCDEPAGLSKFDLERARGGGRFVIVHNFDGFDRLWIMELRIEGF